MVNKPEKSIPYQFFMLALCIYALAALAVDTFAPISEDTKAILGYVDTGICLIFLVDFIRCLIRAPRKLAYLKWGWIDLVSSIPMIEPLRIGRLARIARIIRVLQSVRSAKLLAAHLLSKRAESAFASAALVSVLLTVFGSIAILQFESGVAGSNINTPEDAVWWTVVTITTVGYGDHYPITIEGRIVAAFMMTASIGLFGTFTAFVAAWFLAPGKKKQESELEGIRRELAALRTELTERTD